MGWNPGYSYPKYRREPAKPGVKRRWEFDTIADLIVNVVTLAFFFGGCALVLYAIGQWIFG